MLLCGEANGTPLYYSCLENPMDGGAWWAAVHGVPKSRTRLSNFTFTFHFHALEKETATHSSILAWRIQGRGSLVGCRLWGRTESDTTEATWQQQQQQQVTKQARTNANSRRVRSWRRGCIRSSVGAHQQEVSSVLHQRMLVLTKKKKQLQADL